MDPLSEHANDESGDHPLSTLEVKNIGIINLEDNAPIQVAPVKKRFDWPKFGLKVKNWLLELKIVLFFLQISSAPTTFTSTLIALMTAYLIGSLGLPYILLLILFLFTFRAKAKLLPRITGDEMRNSATNKKPNPESCNWFNTMWTQLWPHWSPIMAESTKTKLKQKLETSLNQSRKKQGPIVKIIS